MDLAIKEWFDQLEKKIDGKLPSHENYWFDTKDASIYLRVSTKTIHRARICGSLKSAKDKNNTIRYKKDWLDDYAMNR